MIRRLLAVAILAGLLLALSASLAAAELRTVVVRLPDGTLRDFTVDVAPGTPLEEIQDPSLPGPVVAWATPPPAEPEPSPRSKPSEESIPAAPGPPAVTDEPPGPAPDDGDDRPDGDDGETDAKAERDERQRRPSDSRRRRADRDQAEPRDDAPKAERRSVPRRSRQPSTAPERLRHSDGRPTRANPTLVDALPGPARPTSVPNFVIRKFRVPVFLLPIYQAAGIQYGVRWEVLAAINEIETDYGRNLDVSSAGAVGWMQFMPSTWELYGVDANRDGEQDPYNPVDAIFAAARYLKAAGAQRDLRGAIFAYNHADWYVDSVLLRTRLIAGVPGEVVGSLTGLTEGRFPVHARARYADDLSERDSRIAVAPGENAARVVEGDDRRRELRIFAREEAPVVAVNDGVVKAIGTSPDRGRYVVLQDAYGNRYVYSGLGSVARVHAVPRDDDERDPRLEAPALRANPASAPDAPSAPPRAADDVPEPAPAARPAVKERLFAHPRRRGAYRAGGLDQLLAAGRPVSGYTVYEASRPLGLDARDVRLRRLRPGSRVIGGTILGRVGRPEALRAPHVRFGIRPAGRGAPRIDPKPILDGWKLLEATAIYRASGRNALHGDAASIGQVLLLPKPLLERRVLADERIELYPCGRQDVRSGQVDRRVLATLAYLAESGLRPTVTSLKCGHSVMTASGNVSHHASGNAVDIAAINGVPILGHQDPGGVTHATVSRLMGLQGTLQADQIISLLDLGGPTLAMSDHHDHVHVGFRPLFGSNRRLGRQALAVLQPGQWHDLIARLREIDNPVVPRDPSRFAVPAVRAASRAHRGE